MTKNMGVADRIIRAVIAIVLAILIATGTITGGWAIVAGIVAVAFLVTSLVSFCPGYRPFGISSVGKSESRAR
jgi:uncharacterized protein (DUF58 family)